MGVGIRRSRRAWLAWGVSVATLIPMSIVDTLRSGFPALAPFGVRHLWVFGSAARAESRPRDVDVLVEFAQPPGLLEYMGLKFKLEELLGCPVDVVSKSACRPRFLTTIGRDLIDVA